MDSCDKELSGKIIACAYRVHNTLGAGFLEKIYENAMALEMEYQGLKFQGQAPVKVRYRDKVVGEYFADLLVENSIICELKAAEELSQHHEVQLVNYLVATGINTGLLINFSKSVTVRRKYRIYQPPANKRTCKS